MKRFAGLCALLILVIAGVAEATVPATLSYQGLLKDPSGQVIPDGTYSLRFRLYNVAVGGAHIWTETQLLPVTDGVFSAVLGTVIPLTLPFDAPYWISLQPAGSTELPRVELTSAPYALRAGVAEALVGGTGDITAVYADNGLTGGATSGEAHVAVGGGVGIVVSADAVAVDGPAIAGAGLVGEGASAVAVQAGTGLTVAADQVRMTDAYSSGTAYDSRFVNEGQSNSVTADMVVPNIVSSLDGVVNDGGNIDLIAGANVTITPDDVNNTITIAAAGGGGGIGGSGTVGRVPKFTAATTIGNSLISDSGTSVTVDGPTTIGAFVEDGMTKQGDPYAGDERAAQQLVVYGREQTIYARLSEADAVEDARAAIFAYRTRDTQNNGSGYGVSYTNNAITGYNYWGDLYTFGVAGYSYNDYTRTGGVLGSDVSGNTWGALGYKDELSRTWGFYTPSASYYGGDMTIDGHIRMSKDYGSALGGVAIKAENTNSSGVALWAVTHGGDATIVATQNGTADVIRGFVPTGLKFRVTNTGRVITPVVEITGGADLAEPFAMSGEAEIPAGALVVIDDQNPGQLKLSDRPYDSRVAGVLSGAGGVNPGLTLSQEGKFEGGRNVALTGRVYALADASSGPIRPGDLLTTSSRPGHAMKATDPQRSHGAVIGKAMSSLDGGTGLVLVLVNLQ